MKCKIFHSLNVFLYLNFALVSNLVFTSLLLAPIKKSNPFFITYPQGKKICSKPQFCINGNIQKIECVMQYLMLQKLPTFLPLTFAMSLSSHINSGGILSLNRIGEEHTKAQLFLVRIFLGFYYVYVLYLINSLFCSFSFAKGFLSN